MLWIHSVSNLFGRTPSFLKLYPSLLSICDSAYLSWAPRLLSTFQRRCSSWSHLLTLFLLSDDLGHADENHAYFFSPRQSPSFQMLWNLCLLHILTWTFYKPLQLNKVETECIISLINFASLPIFPKLANDITSTAKPQSPYSLTANVLWIMMPLISTS